ncbi:hypothetical protein GCM10023330_17000 [Litoribaculum gwangyangense]|uniref:Internalin n=2 Tax=Litoribaculum gwangyangense TaxID=1130722 RepID=A0ABP9CG50_9FLAO
MYSCDDGDIITVELDFGETFSACEGVNDLVLYKTKKDPSESLSVLIPNYSLDELLELNTDTPKSATLYYRTYSETNLPNNLFCNEIPPNVNIISNNESSVTAIINTTLVEDDNDGILAILEDINGNGNLEDDDTDGDGLPNYIDADDDGDNILTRDENPDTNNDGNLSDAQDTDGDGTPDYLDDDDDGDMVKTRDEENASQDNNPANDITNPDVGADFLNPDISTTQPATGFRQHSISRTYTVNISLNGVSFDFISQEPLNFGNLNSSEIPTVLKSRTVTPPFN